MRKVLLWGTAAAVGAAAGMMLRRVAHKPPRGRATLERAAARLSTVEPPTPGPTS